MRSTNDIDKSEINDTKNEHISKSSSFIIQKYIESPLLFENRKFDIRVWALINHNMELYVFK